MVRSLSWPNSGLPTIANKAPVPATSERLAGARSLPTRSTIFSASVTSRGEISSRMAAMYAAAYQVTKPQPTGRTTAGWDVPPSAPLAATAPWGT